jgi:hypothetical protein
LLLNQIERDAGELTGPPPEPWPGDGFVSPGIVNPHAAPSADQSAEARGGIY